MNKFNKIFLALIVLSIAVAGLGLVSASDINDDYVTDSDFNDESLAVDDSISENDHKAMPRMELPRGYENKKAEVCDESDDIDLSDDETDVAVKNDTHSIEDNGTARKAAPSSSDKIIVTVNNGVSSIDVGRVPKVGTGTFNYLQTLVNMTKEGSTLHLNSDYFGGKNSKITVNKNLTIDGQGHTIDCKKADKCFAFYSKKGNIILKNLNIKNGHNNDLKKGGAIYIGGSASYTLINCNLTDNWAEDYGGAIYNDVNKKLIIKNCFFRNNNVSDDQGGAIYSKGKLYAERSDFTYNNAKVDGGAIFCKNNVEVIGCFFKYNKAKGAKVSQCYGGAIRSKENVSIENSSFDYNYAADYGGAVYAKNIYVNQKADNLTDVTSFFTYNIANDDCGGALYAEKDLRISYSKLTNNHANEDGGAAYCNDAIVQFCEFSDNSAIGTMIKDNYGGALLAYSAENIYGSSFHHNFVGNLGGAVASPQVNMWDGAHSSFYDNKVNKESLDCGGCYSGKWWSYQQGYDVFEGYI